MKRLVRASLVLVVGLMITGTAFAGLKTNIPVTVNTTSRFAAGAIGSARNSADAVQNIGCSLSATPTSAARVFCFARNAANVYGSCSSSDPKLVAAAQSINPDSYVYFAWDTTGACTFLSLYEVSYYPPKNP